jgi:hypothetical protein
MNREQTRRPTGDRPWARCVGQPRGAAGLGSGPVRLWARGLLVAALAFVSGAWGLLGCHGDTAGGSTRPRDIIEFVSDGALSFTPLSPAVPTGGPLQLSVTATVARSCDTFDSVIVSVTDDGAGARLQLLPWARRPFVGCVGDELDPLPSTGQVFVYGLKPGRYSVSGPATATSQSVFVLPDEAQGADCEAAGVVPSSTGLPTKLPAGIALRAPMKVVLPSVCYLPKGGVAQLGGFASADNGTPGLRELTLIENVTACSFAGAACTSGARPIDSSAVLPRLAVGEYAIPLSGDELQQVTVVEAASCVGALPLAQRGGLRIAVPPDVEAGREAVIELSGRVPPGTLFTEPKAVLIGGGAGQLTIALDAWNCVAPIDGAKAIDPVYWTEPFRFAIPFTPTDPGELTIRVGGISASTTVVPVCDRVATPGPAITVTGCSVTGDRLTPLKCGIRDDATVNVPITTAISESCVRTDVAPTVVVESESIAVTPQARRCAALNCQPNPLDYWVTVALTNLTVGQYSLTVPPQDPFSVEVVETLRTDLAECR